LASDNSDSPWYTLTGGEGIEMPAAPSPTQEATQGDSGILEWLAKRSIVALLRGVEDRTRPHEKLWRYVRTAPSGNASGVSSSTFKRDLKSAVEHGLVAKRGLPAQKRADKGYELRRPGRELLEVDHVRATWEVGVPASTRRPARRALIDLIAHPDNRKIMRALSPGGLTFTELELRSPGTGRSTLERHTRNLRRAGLVESRRVAGQREIRHELTDLARTAAALLLAASCWHGRWTPERIPGFADDLPGLLCLGAPLARVATELEGTCRLRTDSRGKASAPHDVDLRVAAGHLTLWPIGAAQTPSAHVHGSHAAWCEALSSSDPGGLTVDGDRVLARTAIEGLAEAFRRVRMIG